MLQHLRRERDDLHIPLLAQLPGDRAEDARRPRLARLVDQHRRVLVEPDVGAVLAAGLPCGAPEHRPWPRPPLSPAGRGRGPFWPPPRGPPPRGGGPCPPPPPPGHR